MATLEVITNLAEQMLSLEERIVNGEELLKKLKADHRAIQEGELPELMEAAELEEIKLANGRTIALEQHTHAKIPSTRETEAFGWLKENGYGSIVKRTLVVTFPKDTEKKARRLFAYLTARVYLQDSSIVSKEAVHAQTLKAFVRQAIEDGEDIPHEAFGIYQRLVAKASTKKRERKQK